MTKFSLLILTVLNDNNVETPSKALSVSQILALMDEKKRKSYSTTFLHLHEMEEMRELKTVISYSIIPCKGSLDNGMMGSKVF